MLATIRRDQLPTLAFPVLYSAQWSSDNNSDRLVCKVYVRVVKLFKLIPPLSSRGFTSGGDSLSILEDASRKLTSMFVTRGMAGGKNHPRVSILARRRPSRPSSHSTLRATFNLTGHDVWRVRHLSSHTTPWELTLTRSLTLR